MLLPAVVDSHTVNLHVCHNLCQIYFFKCESSIQICTPLLKFDLNSAFDVTNIVLLNDCKLVTGL